MVRPSISVIIVAHDRNEYLKLALNSVLNQTLQREDYEVIIVKNFSDKLIDEYSDQLHIRTVLTHAESLGSKLVEGVKLSQGDICTFLEDDDMFEPLKLERILKVFLDHQDTVFVHNSYTTIDERGEMLPVDYYSQPSNWIVIPDDKKTEKNIGAILKINGFHNVSSISIRKRKLLPFLDVMHKMKRGADAILFYFALEAHGTMEFVPWKLTKFMFHTSMTHELNPNIFQFLDWSASVNGKLVIELQFVYLFMKRKVTLEILAFYIIEFSILQKISDPRMNKVSITKYLNYLVLALHFRLIYPFPLALVGILTRILPSVSGSIYYRRYKNLVNKFGSL